MENVFEKMFDYVEQNKQPILDAERYIWNNPEPGYKEYKTHKYLAEQFEKLGYKLNCFSDIPGFYTDVETGKPGPKIAVFGELDSLVIPSHPECDKETGAVHACGHNCQTAGLLGVAIALKTPGILDNLCGSIRLIAVPAEEGIELEFRKGLIKKGVIKYISGKLEIMNRGVLDDVDMAFLVHASSGNLAVSSNRGSNGCMIKTAVFKGKSAHAGGAPHLGINALYAANAALNAANALRETFRECDYVRFHPIITKGGDVVNAIPDEVVVESYVRAATLEAMSAASDKINRAFAGAAASMGCELQLHDMHGYAPRYNDPNFNECFHEACSLLYPEDMLSFNNNFGTGCSDLGDVSCVMPAIHPNFSGSVGQAHGINFFVTDPHKACVMSAKAQTAALVKLLQNGAEKAKFILQNKKVQFNSVKEYLSFIDTKIADINAVTYNEDGTVTLKYKM